jgi:hypothetical protein
MRLTLLAAILAVSIPASADPDKSAGASEAQVGQKLYEDNQFKDAAAHFAHAYELDPQPAYLFDAAQAYRFAKDCTNAAKFYRRFLEVAKQAQNLDKVKRYISEMDECATVQPTPPPPVQSRVEPPPQAQQPPPPPPPHDVVDNDPGATQRHLGLALGGVGLLSTGIGIYFTSKVYGDQVTCSQSSPCTQARIDQSNTDGPKHERYEKIAYSVGGAAIVGGIVLYVLGKSSAPSEQGVTLAPTRNGAALSFTF